jgi:hypothetical protein
MSSLDETKYNLNIAQHYKRNDSSADSQLNESIEAFFIQKNFEKFYKF